MSDERKFVSIAEASRRTGWKKSSLRANCREGFFEGAYKHSVTRAWLIPEDQLTRLEPRKLSNYLKQVSLVGIILFVFATISMLADLGGARTELQVWWQKTTFQQAQEGETLILIFPFYYSNGVTTTEPHRILERELKAIITSEGLTDFRVEIYPQTLNQDDRAEAEKIGQQMGATVVLYGEELPQETMVNVLGVTQGSLEQVSSGTERSLLASPAEYARFVTEGLPQETATLSFFAIGLAGAFEQKPTVLTALLLMKP